MQTYGFGLTTQLGNDAVTLLEIGDGRIRVQGERRRWIPFPKGAKWEIVRGAKGLRFSTRAAALAAVRNMHGHA